MEEQRQEHCENGAAQELVPVVWNELVASQQKPTKWLGRTALVAAWEDLDLRQGLVQQQLRPISYNESDWNDKVDEYIQRFFNLMMVATTAAVVASDESLSSSTDARLIWYADRGRAELARRAADRQRRAADRIQTIATMATATSPQIEELPSDADDDNE